ncbi:hypothetical protein E2C01_036451 [Portunus trituberculatus]|uniref:Uncharacterized protein n=1 Tax=Portunus trituberculatus TaxID=210409 RepID=A0A5B7F5Q3_PORTR|nr:hypothetical protein [Portunus trituberculatus]
MDVSGQVAAFPLAHCLATLNGVSRLTGAAHPVINIGLGGKVGHIVRLLSVRLWGMVLLVGKCRQCGRGGGGGRCSRVVTHAGSIYCAGGWGEGVLVLVHGSVKQVLWRVSHVEDLHFVSQEASGRAAWMARFGNI